MQELNKNFDDEPVSLENNDSSNDSNIISDAKVAFNELCFIKYNNNEKDYFSDLSSRNIDELCELIKTADLTREQKINLADDHLALELAIAIADVKFDVNRLIKFYQNHPELLLFIITYLESTRQKSLNAASFFDNLISDYFRIFSNNQLDKYPRPNYKLSFEIDYFNNNPTKIAFQEASALMYLVNRSYSDNKMLFDAFVEQFNKLEFMFEEQVSARENFYFNMRRYIVANLEKEITNLLNNNDISDAIVLLKNLCKDNFLPRLSGHDKIPDINKILNRFSILNVEFFKALLTNESLANCLTLSQLNFLLENYKNYGELVSNSTLKRLKLYCELLDALNTNYSLESVLKNVEIFKSTQLKEAKVIKFFNDYLKLLKNPNIVLAVTSVYKNLDISFLKKLIASQQPLDIFFIVYIYKLLENKPQTENLDLSRLYISLINDYFLNFNHERYNPETLRPNKITQSKEHKSFVQLNDDFETEYLANESCTIEQAAAIFCYADRNFEANKNLYDLIQKRFKSEFSKKNENDSAAWNKALRIIRSHALANLHKEILAILKFYGEYNNVKENIKKLCEIAKKHEIFSSHRGVKGWFNNVFSTKLTTMAQDEITELQMKHGFTESDIEQVIVDATVFASEINAFYNV